MRTAGVAFAGCTVPGQDQPLFSVAPDQMEIGLGIHGEPGVRVAEQMPARDIAAMLVETLLAEAPAETGSDVAVLVNGLGGTKYEEMFVFYNDVAALLDQAGLQAYNPLIGEFVTSLDMTGMSLSLFWLDDDLKSLLDATASTPAFTSIGPDVTQTTTSVSSAPAAGIVTPSVEPTAVHDEDDIPGGEFGESARAALRQALATIEEMESELGRLDAAAGDGDHGAGMVRGLRAAVEAIDGFDGTARQTFRRGGVAFQNAAGGASGALVGAWLMAIGTGLPDRDEEVDAAALALALDQALAILQGLGQAQPVTRRWLTPSRRSAPHSMTQPHGDWESPTPGQQHYQRVRQGCSRRSTWSVAAAAPRGWASARGVFRMLARRRSTTSCTPSARGSRSSDGQEKSSRTGVTLDCRRRTSFNGSLCACQWMTFAALAIYGMSDLWRIDVKRRMKHGQRAIRGSTRRRQCRRRYEERLKKQLEADPRVDVIDLGVPDASDDRAYPLIGIDVAQAVARGDARRGVARLWHRDRHGNDANKGSGVRATVAHDSYSVERSVLSNDCQVLTLGARVIGLELAKRLVDEWLDYGSTRARPRRRKWR